MEKILIPVNNYIYYYMRNNIVQLNESDLLRIVKRIIRENKESDLANNLTDFIKNKVPSDDLKFILQMYNELGKEKFEDVVEDGVTDAVEDIKDVKMIDEKVSLSKKGVDVETEADFMKVLELKSKINSICTNYLKSMPYNLLVFLIGTIVGGFGELSSVDQSSVASKTGYIEKTLLISVLMSGFMQILGLFGQYLAKKTPVNLNYKYPESIAGSSIEKKMFMELSRLNPDWNYEHALKLLKDNGIPEKLASEIIHDFEMKNNMQFFRTTNYGVDSKDVNPYYMEKRYRIPKKMSKANYKRKK